LEKFPEICEMPNLIELQTKSFDDFLQIGVPKSSAKTWSPEVFQEVFRLIAMTASISSNMFPIL